MKSGSCDEDCNCPLPNHSMCQFVQDVPQYRPEDVHQVYTATLKVLRNLPQLLGYALDMWILISQSFVWLVMHSL